MLSSVLGLFTGDNKYVYIALLICGLGFAGMTWLSVELYADKKALKTINEKQAKSITEQKAKIDELQNTLVVKRGEIEAQNARLKQMEADKAKNEAKAKEEKALITKKYESLRDSLNFKVDKNATNANDVKQFVNGFHWVR
ncbi:MAG: hypothetical protein QMB85_08410 [Sulfurospirillum sp.]